MKTAIIMGTRPEIIKLSPIIKKLNQKNSSIILTGQHYDASLSLRFIRELNIRKPEYSLKLSKSNPNLQIGEIIIKLTKILKNIKPDSVIIQGDTNTVLAAGISALKMGIPINHVEAGLRSFDWRMSEEHNRIAIDHLSELLFAPTKQSQKNLISEKVHGKIFVTGNTAIDAINQNIKLVNKNSSLEINEESFVLLTLHRAENVDDPKILSTIIKAVLDSGEKFIFPVHPRTKKRLIEFQLLSKLKNSANITLIDSVGYFDILKLMKSCLFIVTDSGGIQEESTAPTIRKKVIIVRKTTDRPESVEGGFAELAGVSYSKIKKMIQNTAKNPHLKSKNSPYGSGDASGKILKILKKI